MAIKGRRSTPEERLRAVQLLKEGNEAALVARMFGVSRAIVFRWQQKYDEGGPAALETKKTPGPASRLSPTQVSQLYAIITGCDPRQLQFDFGLWTRKIIRDLIRKQFGVKFSEVQASVRTDHHAGTTWGPVGQTPVVVKTGERKSVSMVSAISPRGELRFRVQEDRMNAARFIDFLKALLDSVPGKIFLIVDGHPVHKAKKVKAFTENEADGRLKIFLLPPYSPDLNPDEWVWNNVKNDRVARRLLWEKMILRLRQSVRYADCKNFRTSYAASSVTRTWHTSSTSGEDSCQSLQTRILVSNSRALVPGFRR